MYDILPDFFKYSHLCQSVLPRNKLRWSACCYAYYVSQLWRYQRVPWRSDVGFNTLRPRQNGRHLANDIFKSIFLNANAWISLKISLKFVATFRINIIPALVQIMAWRRPGDKPLSEPMMVSLLTHICVNRPQWVNHGLSCYVNTWSEGFR